jgi:hypothetical protein
MDPRLKAEGDSWGLTRALVRLWADCPRDAQGGLR